MFPELLVCLDGGNTEFALSETDLRQQTTPPWEYVYHAETYIPVFCDRGHFGDGATQHPENALGFRMRFSVEGIYADISTSCSNGGQYIYWETFLPRSLYQGGSIRGS